MRDPVFLRAADEAAAIAALPDLRLPGEAGWRDSLGHAGALDVIGGIVAEPAVIDPDTAEVIAEAVMLPGWHANFYPGLGAAADALLALLSLSGLVIPAPDNPVRLPAGYVVPEGEGE